MKPPTEAFTHSMNQAARVLTPSGDMPYAEEVWRSHPCAHPGLARRKVEDGTGCLVEKYVATIYDGSTPPMILASEIRTRAEVAMSEAWKAAVRGMRSASRKQAQAKCSHPRTHHEGSLGDFCDLCGRPV